MGNNVLIGPVFSLNNLEAHVGHVEQEVWDEIRQLQVGLKTNEQAWVKEFNLTISKSEDDYVRYTARLGQVVFREYTKLDKLLFPVFKFFGNIINKLRGL